jgi:hypothetical protein
MAGFFGDDLRPIRLTQESKSAASAHHCDAKIQISEFPMSAFSFCRIQTLTVALQAAP